MNEKKWKTGQLAIFSICAGFLGLHCGLLFAPAFKNSILATHTFAILHLIIILSAFITFIIFTRKYKSKARNALIAAFAIILLLSIFYPAWYKTQQGAKTVACMWQLKQLNQAITMYYVAHDGRMPTPNKWCDLLINHTNVTREYFQCPANKKERCSYALNPNADLISKDKVVLLFESYGGWNKSGKLELLTMNNHKHRESCNILFTDGTVTRIKPKELGSLKWKNDQ